MIKQYKRVLTIAGSDSGGGAGIQADIKTISACGCYATSAITAITVQNTMGVTAVHPIPLDIIAGQINSVLEDIGTDAIKIGMLVSSDVIRLVHKSLKVFSVRNIVIDPVAVSSSGYPLLEKDALKTMKNELLPIARVITPNIPEAELLTGKKISKVYDLQSMARELSMHRTVSVLLKAGHLNTDDCSDLFYNAEEDSIIPLPSSRIITANTHGTGCTLSSALASYLAMGLGLNEAVIKSKQFISQAIFNGANYQTGKGKGPVHHFFSYWK